MTRIRLGMVGGGRGSFIGGVHRIAARMDGLYDVVAGVFSSDAERNKGSAEDIGVEASRAYGSIEDMIRGEQARADAIEAVVIATPNHLHFEAAKACLEAGLHVICDKPVTATLEDAIELEKIVGRTGKHFFLTHNYTGYPMVRQMRDMVAAGELGEIRTLHAEYVQDWLTEPMEHRGAKGAEWRTDPSKSGAGGSIGDIGTHAYNLSTFVLGRRPSHLLADLSSFVPGRRLDDNASILLRYENGAKGTMWVSQVAVGNENHFTFRVYGSKGGLEWEQEDPNRLWFTQYGKPKQLLTRGGAQATSGNTDSIRIPAGHPEGFLEAFANLYRDAALVLRGKATDRKLSLPGIREGVEGLEFVDACVRSSSANGAWVDVLA
ncbi:Gfo/Idh/MocA family oxidoreductase [Rhizobium sp. P44RR-XXIV]|uniref:Gfo/Idh/MocA family protein n=1 Tax=Rhizobium sp. P44RR-XXIV TaxID=1921145 RepID=UPI00098740AB|nr:Gfo/Idh/MocA family oxidoreductase [Rhizobium sp. P44RR-XXIV]TIX87636.1 Gfo/Idh/MocA family oxidoreductase [Rhizobium sp. P44RR-XXIV]